MHTRVRQGELYTDCRAAAMCWPTRRHIANAAHSTGTHVHERTSAYMHAWQDLMLFEGYVCLLPDGLSPNFDTAGARMIVEAMREPTMRVAVGTGLIVGAITNMP